VLAFADRIATYEDVPHRDAVQFKHGTLTVRSSLGLAVQASGVWAGLPGDGASAASGRQPEAASTG
jgi:hypothetical protein